MKIIELLTKDMIILGLEATSMNESARFLEKEVKEEYK
jgi:hypothetical protein